MRLIPIARSRCTAAFDILLLSIVAAGLIWPLFQVEYFDNWMSIDGAFISDARFLSTHGIAAEWAPDFYCGNRLAYLYPPAIRYGTVLIAHLFDLSTARAYHLYSAVMYCLGAAGVYALTRVASGSRARALGAAVGSLLLSPVLAIFRDIRLDSALHMPQHLNIIVKWGEVAHMSSLSLLILALAAAWLALGDGRPILLALAALLCALTVSFNLYGAIALAILFAIMVWTFWTVAGGRVVWKRAAVIVSLAYGLTAWWLTPSFLVLTAKNLQLVAQPANTQSRLLAVVAIAAFGAIALRFGRGHPERAWPLFLAGGVGLFGLNAVGYYYFHFRALGEPHRLIPEFDLLLILASIECLRARPRVVAVTGGLVLAISLWLAAPYIFHPWRVYLVDRHPERRIEYRLADWLARNMPGERVHAAGSLGFWSDAWRDIPEVGGVSDQGMENQNVAMANWQIQVGDRPARDIYWLQALGADAIVVHGARSQECFHAIRDTHKFSGRLPVLYDSGQDDVIYAVPRRFPALARVVDRRRVESLPPIPWDEQDEPQLRAYAEAIEQGPDIRPSMRWPDERSIQVHARVNEGQSVVIQETYDPAWRAWAAGHEVPVRRDALGFMRVDPPAGTADLYLHFDTPMQNQVGDGLTIVSLGALLWLAVSRRKTTRAGLRIGNLGSA